MLQVQERADLQGFIHFLYKGQEGYVRLAAGQIGGDGWQEAHLHYPSQLEQIVETIEHMEDRAEVYICPSLFSKASGSRENFKVSTVAWADFDGTVPEDWGDNVPTVRLQTSTPGHEHVYWKLQTPITDPDELELVNRNITYKYGADVSGWDVTQLLRPVHTGHHKHGVNAHRVTMTSVNAGASYFPEAFVGLADNLITAGTVSDIYSRITLPSLDDILFRNSFPQSLQEVFLKQPEQYTRSAALTQVACLALEAGFAEAEVYVLLDHCATKWGKFNKHSKESRARQLAALIEWAVAKTPRAGVGGSPYAVEEIVEYNPLSLLNSDLQVEWAIEEMLPDNGVMILAGPSGVGKTQFSMQWMVHLAAGKDYLGYKIPRPQRIGFFSLEMGAIEIKSFLQSMYPFWDTYFTEEELQAVNANLTIIPMGESVAINHPSGQAFVEAYIVKHQWDGVFIDSIGSAIVGNISSSPDVQAFTNFNDRMRKHYGVFLWYIHHFRKAAQGMAQRGGNEDLFGDQYITARATSVYTVMETKDGIKVRNSKNRHAKVNHSFVISRQPGLFFIKNEGEATDDYEAVNISYSPDDNSTATASLSPLKGDVNVSPVSSNGQHDALGPIGDGGIAGLGD